MILFIGVAMLICGVLYGYIARRLLQGLSTRKKYSRKLIVAYLFVCWMTSLLPIIFHGMGISGSWVDLLTWFVYLNLGFFSLLFVFYVAFDVLQLARAFYRQWLSPMLRAKIPEQPNHERRAMMSNVLSVGMLGATGSLTGIGIHQAVAGAVVREVNVPLGNVPLPLQKLRIVQFTDLHIGPMIKRDYVATIVAEINALKPDVIVMTGDLVDGSVNRLQHDVAPLAELEARYGKYFITGNHEYYSGAEAWIAHMQYLGFQTLINEHTLISHEGADLLLAGVTDYRAHQYLPEHASSPAKAIQGAPAAAVKILLAHQPKSIEEATKAGFDLQISGHTHGGQYYPWNFIAKMVNPYIQGLHKHKNKTWIYVSPGTGYWGPPIRLGTEPEITLFRLS